MLTSRDREIASWIARMGAIDVEHVMARFGMGRTAAYRRLNALAGVGLVEPVRLVHGASSLFIASSEALRWTDSLELGACRPTPATVRHWQLAGWAAIAVEREFGVERVLSEREVRAWERSAGEFFASSVVGRLPSGADKPHRPDLAVLSATPGEVALVIEVELSRKARRRLEAILRGYGRNRRVGRVRYYAPPRIAQGLARAARAVHAADLLDLRPLAELESVGAREAA